MLAAFLAVYFVGLFAVVLTDPLHIAPGDSLLTIARRHFTERKSS